MKKFAVPLGHRVKIRGFELHVVHVDQARVVLAGKVNPERFPIGAMVQMHRYVWKIEAAEEDYVSLLPWGTSIAKGKRAARSLRRYTNGGGGR